MKTLILGGARSGKSQFAEQEAKAGGKKLFYLATGWAGDTEMEQRIEQHRLQRGDEWTLVEEPISVASALQKIDGPENVVVLDCLTLWLSNLFHEKKLVQERDLLFELLPDLQSAIFFVSNEVGSGIVPMGELNRIFADEAGRLNQALAQLCNQVYLVVAGIPLQLKAPAIG